MQSLDRRRRQLQQEIVELCGHISTCQACIGFCCRGVYNHFTVVDYLVRMYSDNPVAKYGVDLQKLSPVYIVILKRIVSVIRRRDEFDHRRLTSLSTPSQCPDLTETGCRFVASDRPIRCVLWTCSALRHDLSDDDFRKVGKLTRELCTLSNEVIQAFSHVRQ